MGVTLKILTGIVLLGFVIGCSKVADDHPDIANEKCDACHYLPPRDSGKALSNNPALYEVHYFHVGEKEYSCDVCHSEYDKVTGKWVLLPDHNKDTVKFDSSSCYNCHEYLNCNNPECHSTPPGNPDVKKDPKQPFLKKMHDWHNVLLIDSITGKRTGVYPCDYCHKGFDNYNRESPLDLPDYHDNGNSEDNVQFDFHLPSDPVFPPMYEGQYKCTNIYCHGNTLVGGRDTVSILDKVDTVGNGECSYCHNIDTLAVKVEEHAREDHADIFLDCLNCHKNYSYKIGSVNDSLHINGKVDLSADLCLSCHSDYGIPPPFKINPDGSVSR